MTHVWSEPRLSKRQRKKLLAKAAAEVNEEIRKITQG